MEGIVNFFYKNNVLVVSHIFTAVTIFVIAIVMAKLFNLLVSRWEKKIVANLEKKHATTISSVETKTMIVRRIVNAGIYFFALILFLLQFESVRSIGAGLLASAGVAGIVIGMAAQNTLSNIIAGISISFAQPIRLNDAVIFENDWGWVEEISLMHTIIRTWDNRRIIVPNNILASKVIQNWTIKDPSLLGIVMMYVDYTCDIENLRKWVKEIVKESTYSTEERVAVVQVVDFTEKTMVVRILGKGPDSSNTWSLRCEIREKLIKKFKEAGLPLPKIRITSEKDINFSKAN